MLEVNLVLKTCVNCWRRQPAYEFGVFGQTQYCNSCHGLWRVKGGGSSLVSSIKRKQRPLTSQERHIKTLKQSHGISYSTYLGMSETQGHKCAICKEYPRPYKNGKSRPLQVDHSHRDGRIRGLLCNDCNVALGLLRDDVSNLVSAMDYLCANDTFAAQDYGLRGAGALEPTAKGS